MKVPTDLQTVLASKTVATLWDALTPIARRDFITWVTSAKQSETRKKRITRTRQMLMEGKRRPCCYAVVPMHLYKALGKLPKAKAAWKLLSPDKRRDYVAFVEAAKDTKIRRERIEKLCVVLVRGASIDIRS